MIGIAPWLELHDLDAAEQKQQAHLIELAQRSLDFATNPKSPDAMNFSVGRQPLVDAAFLAVAILRAPRVLWKALDRRLQRQVITALKLTPRHSNAHSE